MARVLGIVIAAILLAGFVVRTAMVELPAAKRPFAASAVWPGHPVALTEQSMTELGTAARDGQPLSAATLARVAQLAQGAPLSIEPFLIHGALAQSAGHGARAEALFAEARRRDPRSPAARYFLADRYLRTGRIVAGLHEVAMLARMVPGAAGSFIPTVADYARTPGAIAPLREFFRASPDFEPAVLGALATDSRNTDLILALASNNRAGAANAAWRSAIVNRLIDDGAFAKSYAVWKRLADLTAAPALFNPGFRPSPAPPPYNWTLADQGGGSAAPVAAGLKVVHYGREEMVLASQMMLLAPGAYQFSMAVGGHGARGLGWRVQCVPGNSPILSLPIDIERPSRLSGQFVVAGSGCPAQRLELIGSVVEEPRTVELTITDLALTKAIAR